MNNKLLKIFDNLCYGNTASIVFDDLLSVVLTQFCPPPHGEEMHKSAMSRLHKNDLVNEFVYELIRAYSDEIETDGWCDPWGDLYQEIAGTYKTSALGQYFTPKPICDFLAQINNPEGARGKIVNDPACGSGRMLLAYHAQHSENFMFGEDFDPICAKMCVVNFAFHGCIGEVINHNTLSDPTGLLNGWRVANVGLPIPAIIPINKEQSFICSGVKWFNPFHDAEEEFKKLITKMPADAEIIPAADEAKEIQEVVEIKGEVDILESDNVEQVSLFG